MSVLEIISYFAEKSMGSKILGLVDLVWEKLDDVEKQFAKSLIKSNLCQVSIKSHLSQKELDEEIKSTSYIPLVYA